VEDVSKEIEEAVAKIIESRNYSRIKVIKVLLSKVSKGDDIYRAVQKLILPSN
jgi:hypothetical protein